MLQSFRDKMQGFFAWFIVVILVLMFLLWGVSSYIGSSQMDKIRVVAKVNDQEISQQNFNNIYQRAYREQAQSHGGNINLVDTKALKQELLKSMITQKALVLAAEKLGFNASNSIVDQFITHQKYFEDNGVFSKEKMDQALQHAGVELDQLRKDFRQDLLINQVGFALSKSEFALPNEVFNLNAQQQQLRKVKWLIINPVNLSSSNPSVKQIKQYYAKHEHKFYTEPKVSIKYILLSYNQVEQQVGNKLTEDDPKLQQYYADNLVNQNQDENTKQKLRSVYIKEQAMQQYERLGNQLQQLSFENPDSLAVAAESLNVPVLQTKLFSQTINTAGKVDKNAQAHILNLSPVRKAAFSDDVLSQRINSDVINLPDHKVLVMHLNQYKPAVIKPLKQVSAEITKVLTKQQQGVQAKKLAEQITKAPVNQVNSILHNNKLEWGNIRRVSLLDQDVPEGLLMSFFHTQLVSNIAIKQQPINKLVLDDNKVAIYQLQSIEDKPVDQQEKPHLDALSLSFIALMNNILYQDYVHRTVIQAKVVYPNSKR